MQTNLLRIAERTYTGGRNFRGLGQLQPVLFGRERGAMTLRIEGVAGGRPCWHVLPFPAHKAEAKRLLGELIACKAEGRPSAARIAWEACKPASGGAIVKDGRRLEFAAQYARPMAAAGLDSYRYWSPYGGIAIGATSTADALREAARSLSSGETPDIGLLQRWNGEAWESVQ